MKGRACLVLFLVFLCSLSFLPILIQAVTVGFSAVNITSIHTCPLDQRTFVIAYSDDTNDDISFQIYDTNGTQILAETDVDTAAGGTGYTSVSVSAFNATTFVIAWINQGAFDGIFAVYNTTGSLLSGPTTADPDGVAYTISVSCFNSTHFVLAWQDTTDSDVTFSVYDSSSNLKTGPTDVETICGNSYSTSVSCFNSTYFVIGWINATGTTTLFDIFMSNGTLVSGPTEVDAQGSGRSVSVACLNSTFFVIGWFDALEGDATYCVYDTLTTLINGPTDVDSAVGASCRSVQVSALNETVFVVSFYDRADFDLTYAIRWSNGTALTSATDIESWPTAANDAFFYQSPCSYQASNSITLYGGNWIIAYANTTTQAIWQAFTPTGAAWDGTIPAQGPQDLYFTLSQSIMLSTYNFVGKELAYTSSGLLSFWDNASMNKAVASALIEFLSSGSFNFSGSLEVHKELSFLTSALLKLWDSSAMLKSIAISMFEAFDAVNIYTYPSSTFTVSTTLDMVLAIGVLALVLSISGIGMVFLRRKQN